VRETLVNVFLKEGVCAETRDADDFFLRKKKKVANEARVWYDEDSPAAGSKKAGVPCKIRKANGRTAGPHGGFSGGFKGG